MKLYELTERYQNILDAIVDLAGETDGEILPEMQDVLDSIEDEFSAKVENCCRVLRNLEAEHGAVASERQRLAARETALKRHIEWFKTYIQDCLTKLGHQKYSTGIFRLSVCRNSRESVIIENLAAVPEEFDIQPERQVSKEAILEAVKSGEEVPGVKVVRGTHLRVK